MLTKPTAHQLRALLAAQSLGCWQGIDQMISAELACVTERLLACRDDSDLHRLQGRALALKELQATASGAREILEATERSPNKPA